ncbi:hypothetical protein B0A52_05189 [Exophiala mesophila]|uniref:SnoaL-like domain-containing protein n=1 Tax=Exophiala mesophila TaxID=212818 RepID=A0A438N4S1_EXOME|nr:hypothetical protein B0A52_05189 [Exophiala mesophila]
MVTDTLAQTLAEANLSAVFSEPNANKRLAAAQTLYHAHVRFYEPGGTEITQDGDTDIAGPEGISSQAGKLLDKTPGWRFALKGPVQKTGDMVVADWKFGPVGEGGEIVTKQTGTDVFLVRGDKIDQFWVIVDGVSDVKV